MELAGSVTATGRRIGCAAFRSLWQAPARFPPRPRPWVGVRACRSVILGSSGRRHQGLHWLPGPSQVPLPRLLGWRMLPPPLGSCGCFQACSRSACRQNALLQGQFQCSSP